MIKKILFLITSILSIVTLKANAQEAVDNASKNFMTSEGKIYVVVAVVVTIITGLFIYLYRLDRKISQLEKSK